MTDTMDAARRRGGHNRSNVQRAYAKLPDDLASIARLLAETVIQVRDGELPPAVGNSIASLNRSLLATLESAVLSNRVDGLHDILERIDAEIGLRVVAS